jgi:hypothetical protein
MNNASHVFDQFAAIFKEGKRPDCLLLDDDIDAMCLHFREVFVLWDRAFSLARIVNPTEEDITTYERYVSAAGKGNKVLECSVTPKVHLMLTHIAWQMRNVRGGLGHKMEDWIEQGHQTGMHLRQRFRTVQNPLVRALAQEKVNSRSTHPNVIAQTDATNEGNKRNFVSEKKVEVVAICRKRQRDMGRLEAIQYLDTNKDKRLTWSAPLFNDAKWEAGEGKAAATP